VRQGSAVLSLAGHGEQSVREGTVICCWAGAVRWQLGQHSSADVAAQTAAAGAAAAGDAGKGAVLAVMH
jgi:hypothetical protein